MWYGCQWDNSQSKSQFIKVNHYDYTCVQYSKYNSTPIYKKSLAHTTLFALQNDNLISVTKCHVRYLYIHLFLFGLKICIALITY